MSVESHQQRLPEWAHDLAYGASGNGLVDPEVAEGISDLFFSGLDNQHLVKIEANIARQQALGPVPQEVQNRAREQEAAAKERLIRQNQ